MGTSGIVWYRRDDLDDRPAPPEPFRSDRLRELVDRLPKIEREIVSRKFFGQVPDTVVAAELGLTPREVRTRLERAYTKLRQEVLEDHGVRSLPAEGGEAPGPAVQRPRELAPAGRRLAGQGVRGEGGEGVDRADVGLHD